MPSSERKQRPDGDTFYIDESDRIQILDRMKSIGMKKAPLARECAVSPAAITLLLSKPISKEEGTRGCKFLGKLQKALGLADTTAKRRAVVVPTDKQRRAERIIQGLIEDPAALENWLENGELRAAKR